LLTNVTFTAVGQSAALVARYSGPAEDNLYLALVVYTSTNLYNVYLFKNIGGSYTQLATTTVTSFTGPMEFKVTGNALILYLNGSSTATLSITDNSITGPGLVGIRTSSGTKVTTFTSEI